MNVAERVQTSIRAVNAATRDAVDAGPFTFFRHRSSDHPMLNYAVPVAGAGEWTGIHELREAFAAHGLPPRLEFVGECAPGLEGIAERVYERCGFRRAGTTMVHIVRGGPPPSPAAAALCDDGCIMTEVTPLQGELQTQIMAAIWRLGEGTVEQIRQALPPESSPPTRAYNTVQTVLNRLAERGLLARRREGHVIVYAPRLSEAEYLSRSMEHTLRGASSQARQVALAQLIGSLPRDEAAELGRLAEEVAAERMR